MEIRIKTLVLQELLEIINLGDIINPVQLFFNEENDSVSVRASDKTKTVQYVLPEWKLFDSEIENAESITVDPGELLGDLVKFKKSKELTIRTGDNVMLIFDNKGNEITYYLKSNSSAVTIPEDKIPKWEDDSGKCLFKKKVTDEEGNQSIVQGPADSVVKIDSTQLQLAVNDMVKHAKTEYIEFVFDEDESFSITGHMDTKAKTSKSGLMATLEGNKLDFTLPKTFAALVNPLEGEIEIQGTEASPAVVFKHTKVDKGDVVVVLMRQKAGSA